MGSVYIHLLDIKKKIYVSDLKKRRPNSTLENHARAYVTVT